MKSSFFSILLLSLVGVATADALQFRVATYNASLNRSAQGQLASELNNPNNAQAKQVAQIIQRVRPDVLQINEFDFDPANPTLALNRFHDNYLAIPQAPGLAPLNYPYRYIAPSNTGIPSGFDLDNNGSVGGNVGSQSYGNDSFGFGEFPGKYSFAIYSKFPIDLPAKRSFQLFKWKDMPANVIPPGYYTAAEQEVFRLSSKNHVDLPIELKPGVTFHLLCSHPTPPSFDSTEDKNGRRNHDEIRLWADYISNVSYLYDDAGVVGGLAADQRFIILGDLNADPLDGDSYQAAVNQLRNHPLVNSIPNPSSPGGTQQSLPTAQGGQGGVNPNQQGNPAYDTSDFNDSSVGNLRVDHVLPSKKGFSVINSGVFWPLKTDPTFPLVAASDHRLVFLDLVIEPDVRNLHVDRTESSAVLSWGTQTGVSYKVQTSPDLLTPFADSPAIPVVLDPATQTATATDSQALPADKRFYRIISTFTSASPAAAASSTAQSRSAKVRPHAVKRR